MIKVGCCGYPVSRERYHKIFRLVELNTTFYEYPKLPTVIKWREEAPREFEFTVKAHRDISHNFRLKTELALKPFERMKETCRALSSKILLIQTPASFKPNSLEEAEKFFKEIDRNGLTLIWETRGPLWQEEETRKKLREVLEMLDVTHVTDPFLVMPVYTGHVAYFRLHGLGPQAYYYQYTNEELLKLYDLVKPFDAPSRDVYILFNNLSMFEDGERFLAFLKDGRFPPLSGAVGLDSVKAIIGKTKYPSSKSMLMKKLGWRLVELEDNRQIRLNELLRGIPSKSYKNADEVLKEIKFP